MAMVNPFYINPFFNQQLSNSQNNQESEPIELIKNTTEENPDNPFFNPEKNYGNKEQISMVKQKILMVKQKDELSNDKTKERIKITSILKKRPNIDDKRLSENFEITKSSHFKTNKQHNVTFSDELIERQNCNEPLKKHFEIIQSSDCKINTQLLLNQETKFTFSDERIEYQNHNEQSKKHFEIIKSDELKRQNKIFKIKKKKKNHQTNEIIAFVPVETRVST